MPAEVGGFEPNTLHDAPGQRAVGIRGNEMLTTDNQVAQFLCLARHTLFNPASV
jgi:hypothetical protein